MMQWSSRTYPYRMYTTMHVHAAACFVCAISLNVRSSQLRTPQTTFQANWLLLGLSASLLCSRHVHPSLQSRVFHDCSLPSYELNQPQEGHLRWRTVCRTMLWENFGRWHVQMYFFFFLSLHQTDNFFPACLQVEEDFLCIFQPQMWSLSTSIVKKISK